MATLNLGRIKPVFRDAYAGGTAYVVDDIVTFGDETFICILASTGNATSNATYWKKLAAKGTDGTDLTSTLTTQGDVLYRDGSGLQRLAKGTAAQVLTINAGATAPEWAAGGGGAWDFVSRNAVGGSDVATIVLTNLATTGENYFLMWNGIDSVANGAENFRLQVSTDNGSAYRTSGYESALFQHYSTGGSNVTYDGSGMMLSEAQNVNDISEGTFNLFLLL